METEFLKHESKLGSDGKVSASIGADQQDLVVQLQARYPINLIVQPALDVIDSAFDKLEKAIPGDWDKPYIAEVKKQAHAELLKRLNALLKISDVEPEPADVPADIAAEPVAEKQV